jgi:hypothetical protein
MNPFSANLTRSQNQVYGDPMIRGISGDGMGNLYHPKLHHGYAFEDMEGRTGMTAFSSLNTNPPTETFQQSPNSIFPKPSNIFKPN